VGPPDAIENIDPAPEGRQINIDLSPLRGWESQQVPVVTLRSTTG